MAKYSDRRPDTSMGSIIPIILVATIIFVAIDRQRSDASDRRLGDSISSDTAFLGGVQREYDSSTFRGGEAEAIMGGIDLDFRGAAIEGNEATLDVTAVMGGVKVRIPRTWNVVNQVEAVLGGVKDRTTKGNGNKQLVITGTVLMGGLEIRN
jgi:predicted membrane protein